MNTKRVQKYNVLVNNGQKPNCCRKWENRLERKPEWKTVFQKIQNISKISLKWQQVRIVHRILGTNIILSRTGIEQNFNCTFCKQKRENINHLFVECCYTKHFWNEFEEIIKSKCHNIKQSIHFSEHMIIFGCDKNTKTDVVFDLLILLD